MCRMIGCVSPAKVDLRYSLLDAPNALVHQSKKDHSGKTHRDGWGIACWDEESAPEVHKNFTPAFEDKLFTERASKLQASKWIAHVRAASAGDVRIENTHPFCHGNWAWVHNGTLVKEIEKLNEIIMSNIAPAFRELRQGSTDSELCFLLFLTELHRRGNGGIDHSSHEIAAAAMQAVINFLNASIAPQNQNPPTMNFMASNGKILVATRWGKSLWTLQHNRLSGKDGNPESEALYIASEPFDESEWREVPDRSLLIVDGAASLMTRTLEV